MLGKRKNKPAKGEWFVPGGTVFKNERRKEAVHRVAQEELNTDVTIERRMGTYEHFYRTAEVGTADGKHYLATAYVVTPHQDQLNPDDQHTELRRFSSPFPEFHPYVDRYLDELGLLERHPAPVEHATGNTR